MRLSITSSLLIASILLGPAVALAQSSHTLGLAVKGGMVNATLPPNGTARYEPLVGPIVGFSMDDSEGGRMGPVFEVSIARRGAVQVGPTTNRRDQWNLWTIQAPILAHVNLRVTDRNHFKPWAVIGIAPAFRILYEIDYGAPSSAANLNLKSQTAWLDFIGVVGAGVSFRRLSGEVRYEHGFHNIASNEPGQLKGVLRANTVTVLAGWRFK